MKPLVTFIVITYKEEWEPYMFIGMLKCLKSPDWKAIIWHDGPNERTRKIVESFKDERIIYMEGENRGAWGCYNRIDALNMVESEYVIQTTIQEYYVPVLLDFIRENSEHDFIYWPCVHHHYQYGLLETTPIRLKIDWSNFAIRTDIAKKVGIKNPTSYIADGEFVEDVMNSGLVKSLIKLDKVLNVKN